MLLADLLDVLLCSPTTWPRSEALNYVQVLEGHNFLGSLSTLGADINTCFGNVIEAATLRAVQHVMNSSRAGGNSRAGQANKPLPPQLANMHDAAKQLLPELFSAALSRVSTHPCRNSLSSG